MPRKAGSLFSCVFVTFPYGVLGQVWYLIVSIPDLCQLSYFELSFDKYLTAFEGKQASRL